MNKTPFIFKEIQLDQIQRDPDQPRKDFGTEGDENRLLISIRDIGIQSPITVSEIEPDKYIIADGHRRYICAQKLNLETVPCRVYKKLGRGDFETIRFEIQNNRRPWKPLERSEALTRIKEANNFKTNKELAAYLHISEILVSNSFGIRNQKIEYIGLMEKYDLNETYRVEFVHLKQKIRKIKDIEADEIILRIFQKVAQGTIKSSKEFRKLGRIFLRASANEEALYNFLTDPDMTVRMLEQHGLNSGFSLLIEQLIQKIVGKRSEGIEFSSQERSFLVQLKDLLNTAV